jgi:hypothetical protein
MSSESTEREDRIAALKKRAEELKKQGDETGKYPHELKTIERVLQLAGAS